MVARRLSKVHHLTKIEHRWGHPHQAQFKSYRIGYFVASGFERLLGAA